MATLKVKRLNPYLDARANLDFSKVARLNLTVTLNPDKWSQKQNSAYHQLEFLFF